MDHHRETRARIEEAVIDEVSRVGYVGASVAGICERAGIGIDEFESEYASLERCYCVVLGRLSDQMLAEMRGAFDSESSWRDGMRSASWAMLKFFEADRRRRRFVGVESLSAGEGARAIVEEFFEGVVQLVDRGRYELDDPDRLTRATAEATVGGVYNVVRLAMSSHSVDPAELTPKLMFNVVHPYLGAEAAQAELRLGRPGGSSISPEVSLPA